MKARKHMETLNFRYSEDTDVTIRDNHSSRNIYFKHNNNIFLKVIYRKYFHGIVFNYDVFSSPVLMGDFVKTTAKDGSAFLAQIYKDGVFYVIRKKKKKPQIMFMKSCENGFKNYQYGKDVADAVCFFNGIVSRDEELINDFFEKRPVKVFNEEEYINSLDSEDKKEYLEEKTIDDVIERVGKKYHISSERIDDLAFYVMCLPADDEIKIKVLSNGDINEIATKVLPMIDTAKRYWQEMEKSDSQSSSIFEDKEYSIDNSHVYLKDDFYSLKLDLKDDEMFVCDLFYFFEDEYEQIKDYLNKGIEKVKKTIDEVLPFFKEFVEGKL